MSKPFDAYHKWLGIAPKDQPPNHYRLLGIDLFESDCDVVVSAADQRMIHVRSFQTGAHSALSQQLLNEISTARVCLLDPKRKAEYDRRLVEQLSRRLAPPAAVPPARPDRAKDSAPVRPPLPPAKDAAGRPAGKAKPRMPGAGIANQDLTENDLPPAGANWNALAAFASSFRAKEHWGTHAACVEIANTSADLYAKLGELPNTLDELRTCLSVEQQRYLEYGWIPDQQRMEFLHAVVEEIRRRLIS